MPTYPPASAEQVVAQPARVQFEAFLEEHRSALTSSIVMLAQECCDFARMFQAQGEEEKEGEKKEESGESGPA